MPKRKIKKSLLKRLKIKFKKGKITNIFTRKSNKAHRLSSKSTSARKDFCNKSKQLDKTRLKSVLASV